LKEGDATILKELYDDYFPLIRQFVRKNSGSTQEAEDVFQEGVMSLYRLVNQPNFELKSQFYTLLYAICRNWWFKQLRKLERVTNEQAEVSTGEEHGILEAISLREREKLYQEKFRQLNPDCQKILQMSFEGASIKEIQQKLKLSSEGYTRKRKFVCKKHLFTLVQSDARYQELKFDGRTDHI
ncbi:MAG: sigma-70 family RNA polymerase sigma factor, partial [Bacteroidota bacterium]